MDLPKNNPFSTNEQEVSKTPRPLGKIRPHDHNGADAPQVRFSRLRFDNYQLPTAYGGTGASAVSAARVNLGLGIGTDIQAWDATLDSIALLGTVANRMIYTTATNTWAEATLTSAARNILDDTGPADTRTTLGLGSLATLSTINNSNWSGTDLSVANGGTGVSSLTAYAPIFGGTTSTGAVQSGTVGTTGQVLTSNGAGALPTFQTASGGTPRRNLNIQLNTTNAQKAGATDPTDSTSINGVQCSTPGVDGGGSILKINSNAANSQWDFYDKNPEMNVDINYTAGSATGEGRIWFGDTADTTPPAQTQTNKGMFIMADTVGGTITWYAVNADGSSNTNTSLTGITSAQQNYWRIVKNSTTSIKFYYNGVLKATHTTNLPSGDCAATSWLTLGIDNDTGDTTTRTAQFGYCDVLFDSPTG